MCKVFIMSGIKPETNTKAVALMKAIAPLMSTANRDGLGYAAIDGQGNLFGERWFKNDTAFKVVEDNVSDYELINALGSAVTVEDSGNTIIKDDEYNSFGRVDLTKMVAVTLHTRWATSAKGFQNTHPFVDTNMDTSLIHNGVIRNDSEFDLKLSSCDSESILISYLRNQVNIDTESVQSMANELIGYYACGVFSRDGNGARILDMFKANGASLSGVFINELGIYVYSTSAKDIKDAAEKVGLTTGLTFTLNAGHLLRFDPITGTLIKKEAFAEGKEWTHTSNYSGSNYKSDYYWRGRGGNVESNVVDATLSQPVKSNVSILRPTKKQLSAGMIEFLKLKPRSRLLTTAECMEFARENHLTIGE